MEVKPSYFDTLRADIKPSYKDFLTHHGIQGQHWGVRRFEDEDGHLTDAGQKRYAHFNTKEYTESLKNKKKSSDKKKDKTKQHNNASNMQSSGSGSGSGIRVGSMKILQDKDGNYYAQLGDQIITGSDPSEVAYNYGAAMRENSRAKVAANNAENAEEDKKNSGSSGKSSGSSGSSGRGGSSGSSGGTNGSTEETPSHEYEQIPIEESVPVSSKTIESEAQPISEAIGPSINYGQSAIKKIKSGLTSYKVKSSDVKALENILDDVGAITIKNKSNRSVEDVLALILGESHLMEDVSDDAGNILGGIGRMVRKDGVAKKRNKLPKNAIQDKTRGKAIKINKIRKIQKKSNSVKHFFGPTDTIPSFKDQLDVAYISHHGIKLPCL